MKKTYKLLIFDWEGTLGGSFVVMRESDNPLYPGVKPMLKKLRQLGYQLAIATGKSRHGLNEILCQQNIKSWFTSICTADYSAAKPAPDMLLEILAQTGCIAEQALMIGDSSCDIAMANAAKVDGLMVGTQTDYHLSGLQTVARLESVLSLEDWLSGEYHG